MSMNIYKKEKDNLKNKANMFHQRPDIIRMYSDDTRPMAK